MGNTGMFFEEFSQSFVFYYLEYNLLNLNMRLSILIIFPS